MTIAHSESIPDIGGRSPQESTLAEERKAFYESINARKAARLALMALQAENMTKGPEQMHDNNYFVAQRHIAALPPTDVVQ